MVQQIMAWVGSVLCNCIKMHFCIFGLTRIGVKYRDTWLLKSCFRRDLATIRPVRYQTIPKCSRPNSDWRFSTPPTLTRTFRIGVHDDARPLALQAPWVSAAVVASSFRYVAYTKDKTDAPQSFVLRVSRYQLSCCHKPSLIAIKKNVTCSRNLAMEGSQISYLLITRATRAQKKSPRIDRFRRAFSQVRLLQNTPPNLANRSALIKALKLIISDKHRWLHLWRWYYLERFKFHHFFGWADARRKTRFAVPILGNLSHRQHWYWRAKWLWEVYTCHGDHKKGRKRSDRF